MILLLKQNTKISSDGIKMGYESYKHTQTKSNYVRFHVLTAASMKFGVFWDVELCSQSDIDQTSTWLHGATSQKNLNFKK
jgi:hypothetical protein